MKDKLLLFSTKIKISFSNIYSYLKNWKNLLSASLIAIIFLEITYWIFNFNVLGKILFSPKISVFEKLSVLFSPIQTIQQSYGLVFLIMLILLSIVQGISIAILIKQIRLNKKSEKLYETSTIASFLAIIGMGCPSCGTSLITPLISIFASGSAVAISEQITFISIPLALFVGLYGLYSIGLKIRV